MFECHQANFNSIKVRLEQFEEISAEWLLQFQFHKGTIRTAGSQKQTIDDLNFNSIKVRLEQHLLEISGLP